jgi:hypothetical protein
MDEFQERCYINASSFRILTRTLLGGLVIELDRFLSCIGITVLSNCLSAPHLFSSAL